MEDPSQRSIGDSPTPYAHVPSVLEFEWDNPICCVPGLRPC